MEWSPIPRLCSLIDRRLEVSAPDVLSIHRSFVIRLYAGVDADAGEISGFVEHVVSGEGANFAPWKNSRASSADSCAGSTAGAESEQEVWNANRDTLPGRGCHRRPAVGPQREHIGQLAGQAVWIIAQCSPLIADILPKLDRLILLIVEVHHEYCVH